jgi:hypothetical protein
MICSGVCLRRAIVKSLLRPAILGNGLSQPVEQPQGSGHRRIACRLSALTDADARLGHRGSLPLRRRALSSPSPCRFIPLGVLTPETLQLRPLLARRASPPALVRLGLADPRLGNRAEIASHCDPYSWP